jgi:hypothetical protein
MMKRMLGLLVAAAWPLAMLLPTAKRKLDTASATAAARRKLAAEFTSSSFGYPIRPVRFCYTVLVDSRLEKPLPQRLR